MSMKLYPCPRCKQDIICAGPKAFDDHVNLTCDKLSPLETIHNLGIYPYHLTEQLFAIRINEEETRLPKHAMIKVATAILELVKEHE